MPDERRSSYTLNITIQNPPYFTLVSQFVDDGEDQKVKFFVSCQPAVAKTIETDARTWADIRGGQVDLVDVQGNEITFSVVVPALPNIPEAKNIPVGAHFLAMAENLSWLLLRKLQIGREIEAFHQKFWGQVPGS